MASKTIKAVLAGAVALAAAGMTAQAHAQAGTEKEKCYGVVKAGKNDCAAANGSHSCGGQAPVDASGDEWVAVPKGLCDKLVNGSVTPVSAPATTAAPAVEAPSTATAPAEGAAH